ncbi:helix-turn-helix domain-containing protein [Asticcacaulis sp. YBE204]|uniref:helix-turn-helix domain-containing protein n=1 Tax=Asticcacaulis sp. YBE204 TaxID=1282363 RepID=UPI0012DE9BAD|nr:helix-turn-helix transcriptional regulator [Asticcacaulis sp. YBE204]
MNFRLILGWNVRRGRIALKLSQEKFAAAAEIADQPTVSELECGEGNPTFKTLEGAATALSITVPQLFDVEGVPNEVISAAKGKTWSGDEIRALTAKYLKNKTTID